MTSSATNIPLVDSSGPSAGVDPPSDAPASASVLGSLWSQALANYKEKTDLDPLTHPLTKDLADRATVDEIMQVFDRKMREFKTFRVGDPKWSTLRNDYLKPAVKVVLSLNDALAEGASHFPIVPGGKAIFVAFGALLKTTEGMTKRYDALIDLFEEIPFFLDSVRVRESNPRNWGVASQKIAVAILVHLLDVFALALKLLKTIFGINPLQRIVHFGQSLLGNTDMQEALRRLRRLSNLEIRAITSELRVDAAESRVMTKKLLENLSTMELAYSSHFSEIISRLQLEHNLAEEERHRAEAARIRDQQQLEQIGQAQADAAASAVLDKLDRLDIADLAAQDRPGCLIGTRVSMLADLAAWAHDPDAPRTYWLNGMAGTGKSAIARSFGRQLQMEGLLGGSFFCSRESSAELKETKRIIPTLSAALAAHDRTYRAALLPVLKKYSSGPRPSTWGLREQVQRLLSEPLSSDIGSNVPHCVLIIDALDETSDESVGELLNTLVSESRSMPIKFFLTSRPEEHIRRNLHSVGSSLRLHDIERDLVEADIYLYVSDRMNTMAAELREQYGLPHDWPSQEDIVRLASLSGVLFIHAFTSTEYIRGGLPVKRLQNVLDINYCSGQGLSPLDHLDRIYQFILESVQKTKDELCLTWRILTAVLTLEHPLTLSALSCLLKIEVSDIQLSLRDLHAVLYVPDNDSKATLSTLHASFGDFLTTPGRAPKCFQVQLIDGHFMLFSRSIHILSSIELHFNMSQAKTSYISNQKQMLAKIPDHIGYACTCWPKHLAVFISQYSFVMQHSDELCFILSELRWVLSYKVLFWLEVCNMLDVKLNQDAQWDQIISAAVLKQQYPELRQLLCEICEIPILADKQRKNCAPHIYLSIIPFLSPSSLLAGSIKPMFSHLITYNLQYTGYDISDEFIQSLVCSPNGDYFAYTQGPDSFVIWSILTSSLIHKITCHARPYKLAFSHDCLVIASNTDSEINIWEIQSGNLLVTLQIQEEYSTTKALVFSLSGSLILASTSIDDTAYVHFWDQPLLSPQGGLHLSVPDVQNISVSFDGSHMCFLHTDDTIEIKVLDSYASVFKTCTSLSEKLRYMHFSLDNSHLLIEYKSKKELWDWSKDSCVEFSDRGYFGHAFSHTYLALMATNNSIQLYDQSGNETPIYLRGHTGNAWDFVSSPDGRYLISASEQKSICLWDLSKAITDSSCYFKFPGGGDVYEYFDGWLTQGHERDRLLLYVPKEYCDYLEHPPCKTRIAKKRLTIDWTGAVHGEDWTKCYIGPKDLVFGSI